MAREIPLGDQELALLCFVAEHGPMSVARAVEEYGAPRGLARTTVLTMMERLRQKRRLARRRVDGVYQYASPVAGRKLLADSVRRFVRETLNGSLSPFAAYLAEGEGLEEHELQELQEVLKRLRSKGKGGGA